jgi:hypothetical protein
VLHLPRLDPKEALRVEDFRHLDRIVEAAKRRHEQIPGRLMATEIVI